MIVPFAQASPLMECAADGDRSGFFKALARGLSDEIGVPVHFRDYASPAATIRAFANAEVHILAATVALEPLQRSGGFSDPVAIDLVKFVVLEDRAGSFPDGHVAGRRVGIVLHAVGFEEQADPVSYRVVEWAPALRFGLGPVREKLTEVIPGYPVSDDYVALRLKYFGKPEFWTEARITAGFAGFGTVLLFLALGFAWQRQKMFAMKATELEREQVHSKKLGAMVAELERSNREAEEFAHIASHDLKEPLRGIRINATFLEREDLPANASQRVQRMAALADRIEVMVSDLLYFSRLGQNAGAAKDVDPAQIVAGIETELAEWLAERNATVHCGELPLVHAEHAKIKTVFQNLIVNGLKYNQSSEKTVQIGFGPTGTGTGTGTGAGTQGANMFWVRDNGVGIEEKNREQVFRIFQRLHREQEFGPGTGSGLSFVRKIIEQYGHQITFTSIPGSGTTFFFSLPLPDAYL